MENNMKLTLIFLLLSLNLLAQEIDPQIKLDRLDAVKSRLESIEITSNNSKSQEVIAKLMFKCDINGNSGFYYKKLFKAGNTETVDCFVLKYPEIAIDKTAQDSKNSSRLQRFNDIGSYDCEKIKSPNLVFLKLLCEERK